MCAKFSPDCHFVGVVKLLVRAHSREAAVDLLRQRLALGETSDLGEVVEYGFVRAGVMMQRTTFVEKQLSPDFLWLMEKTREEEKHWPEDGDPRIPQMYQRLEEYEVEFDRL